VTTHVPVAATRRRRDACRAAAMLALACALAGAAPAAAQLLPLWSGGGTPAAPGSYVWHTLAWDGGDRPALGVAPLAALERAPGVALASEWSPLLRSGDGSRLERARQSVRATAAAGAADVGIEWAQESGLARGGDAGWAVQSGGEAPRDAAFGAALRGDRGALALAVSVAGARGAGFGVEAAAPLAAGWRARARASATSRDGRLDVRWDDRTVAARGAWSERRFACAIAGDTRAGAFAVALDAVDREPARSGAGDALADRLAWRGARADWDARAGALRLGATVAHGAARQRLEVRRDGTAYAVAAGPATERAAELRAGPAAARWTARAWAGRVTTAADAALALWPFDGLAGAAGTRIAASSALTLDHAGVAVDGAQAVRRGWDAGLAAWWLAPRGDFESWRGVLFGLGHDGAQGGTLGVRRAVLAGLRIARTQTIAGTPVRLECVQWAPLAWRRDTAPAAAAGPAPGPEQPGAGGSTHALRTWGGTIIRVSL